MIEEIWNSLIEFSAQFVIPDWGRLVALIPLALLLLTILYLVWLVVRFANAGPTRRGKHRLPPAAPAGIHMPGPSFAPILGAIGTLFLVFGLVAGGIWLLVGFTILTITLLYWGREAMRDYDHMPEAADTAPITGILPAPGGSPPAGVHMPPPSFRPLLAAIGTTLLVAGLVVGGWLILTGLIALAITLLGWLWDAVREYREVEQADRTGHLESGGPPPWPRTIFASLAALVVVGVVLGSGLIGVLTTDIDANAAPPGASGAPEGGEASVPPPPGTEAQVVVTAKNIKWVETELTAPGDAPFTLALDNQDQSVPHDVAIRDAGGADVYKTEIVTGVQTVVFDVPAIPAGSYTFVCTVHPAMTGTLTAG